MYLPITAVSEMAVKDHRLYLVKLPPNTYLSLRLQTYMKTYSKAAINTLWMTRHHLTKAIPFCTSNLMQNSFHTLNVSAQAYDK